jgi:hypothetical protein
MSKSNSKMETIELRSRIINYELIPKVRTVFDKYERIQSAMLLVAQYWDDDAYDAVHYRLIFSVLPTPAIGVQLVEDENDDFDPVNLPGLPGRYEIDRIAQTVYEYAEYSWNNNNNVVPAFAAYCKEGCHQEMADLEAYSPYAVFRRKEGSIEIEVVGEMLRPWLDGVLSGMGD